MNKFPHRFAFLPRLCAVLLAAALVPATAFADEDERTWYDVEIIIFEQREATGRDSERWQPAAPEPAAARTVRLEPPTEGRQAFAQLPDQQLRLLPAYRQLERASEYQPLLHLGWRQQGLPREQAPAVAIPANWTPGLQAPAPAQDEVRRESEAAGEAAQMETVLGEALAAQRVGPPLYGFVRLYRERFLHVGVDLRYHRPTGDTPIEERYPYLQGREPVFVMEQRRRMRSGELHYLDHPVLGVLVLVTPVKDEPAES